MLEQVQKGGWNTVIGSVPRSPLPAQLQRSCPHCELFHETVVLLRIDAQGCSISGWYHPATWEQAIAFSRARVPSMRADHLNRLRGQDGRGPGQANGFARVS